jgi:hypothetical protein
VAVAILNQGKTAIRDSLKTLITHVGVSDDNAAFSLTHTGIDPTANKSTHVGGSTDTDVDGNTFDSTITITGASQFTDKSIFAIGVASGVGIRQNTGGTGTHTGGSVQGTALITRSVRTLGIGVQSGDTFTIGVRVQVQDNS